MGMLFSFYGTIVECQEERKHNEDAKKTNGLLLTKCDISFPPFRAQEFWEGSKNIARLLTFVFLCIFVIIFPYYFVA